MQTVESKFDEIAQDLTYNVTKIYGREDIIIATDLVFHSVLGFNFGDEFINKGWVEAIICGDTGCGKSATLKALHKHYRCGEFITGEDVSRAGLIGGLQKINDRWIISWGRYVRQNREEATIDEAQNLEPEDIANMTGMRSSGVAEITMIHQAKTEAKVRAIWLGNPRSNRFMNSYTHGVLAIKDLIGKLDDIRRFDFGVACALEEVSTSEYHKVKKKKVEHVYTSSLCHDLIMWAWSRKPENIIFDNDSELAILSTAEQLSGRYTSQIPLVNPSEMRIKIARLAVAAAVRTFSTDATFENVIVKPSHVEFIKNFLIRCYDKPTMGYDIFTKVKTTEQSGPNEENIRQFIMNKDIDFLDCMIDYDYLSLSDIMDFTGFDREEGKKIMSFLVKNKCIKKYHSQYIKNPVFNKILRKLKTEHIEGKIHFKEDLLTNKDTTYDKFEGSEFDV